MIRVRVKFALRMSHLQLLKALKAPLKLPFFTHKHKHELCICLSPFIQILSPPIAERIVYSYTMGTSALPDINAQA